MAEDRLERIARAVADGTPVDWALEEANAAPEDRPLLQQLRVVAGIAASAQGPGPGDSWGSLRIVSSIGSGAFGDVFRAHDSRLHRDVALKLLRETGGASEVVAEGRVLAQVRHRGVVTVHGGDRIDGRAGIWMELVEGRTLEDILREQGPWDAKSAALLGAELCAALAAVHATGLVHRDVKAQNVMREPGGRVVLMDFGVGRALSDAPGRPAGTPLYMAPEVLAGEKATPRSDLYSLGVLLYHLVSGGYPIKAESVAGVKRAHDARKRTFLRDARPDLPDAFVQVVERALQPEPERRFASAGEMEHALLESVRPEHRRSSAWPWIAAAVTVAAVALLPLWRREEPRRAPQPAVEAARPSASPTPVASPTARASTPLNDPFVAPLGPGASGETTSPGSDAAYSIDARLDGVQLRIRPSAAVSLYVFTLDATDRPSLVFPSRGTMADNPLVPGFESRVPLWGRRLVAVATLSRLGDFEAAVARQRVPSGADATLPLSEAALERLGAALGFAPRATGRFLAGAPPLKGHVEMLRGVWIRRLER